MSRDSYILLMCDVTEPVPTAGHMESTACSTVAGAYCVYRAVAWQRVDQIRHNTYSLLQESLLKYASIRSKN
jgi:hypothetical protein